MAELTSNQRAEVWSRIMQLLSDARSTVTISKTDLRAAIDAADTWANDNAAAFNTALPQPARSALTSQQKAQLLAYVVLKRYEVS